MGRQLAKAALCTLLCCAVITTNKGGITATSSGGMGVALAPKAAKDEFIWLNIVGLVSCTPSQNPVDGAASVTLHVDCDRGGCPAIGGRAMATSLKNDGLCLPRAGIVLGPGAATALPDLRMPCPISSGPVVGAVHIRGAVPRLSRRHGTESDDPVLP